ncbi:MAG: hypothetical protein DRJ03_15360 [Chloroflexi bacterium]|nr:MAG: hypothetical protein DRJ03_15360 [Chloroflexota bacterium]
MSAMKILLAPAGYTISDYLGSEPLSSYKFISALAKLNEDIEVYVITNFVKVKSPLKKTNIKLYPLNINLQGGIIERAIFTLDCLREGLNIIENHRIDIIHQYLGGPFNLLALCKRDIPFIIGPLRYDPPHPYEEDEHLARWGRSWSECAIPSISEKIRNLSQKSFISIVGSLTNRLSRLTLERANAIVTATHVAKDVYERFIDAHNKIFVVPEGVDCEEFEFTPVPNNYDILTLGAHFKHEGFDYLIKGMPKIVKECNEVRLHVLGDGPRRVYLEKLTKALGLERHVKFHGFVPRETVLEFYKRCRLVVLPSLVKGFGLTQLEAMASGRPVVCTNTIGFRETVISGKTGLIVPIANSDALAEAIITLLFDYKLCRKMGALGRKIAEERYDWGVIAKQYYDVYRRLM